MSTNTRVKSVMTSKPTMVPPGAMVTEAARQMQDIDCGCLPVGSDGDVVGIITDRDIALRVVAQGKNPAQTPVGDVMTKGAYTIEEDEDIEHAAAEMQTHNVARLVVTAKKKVTGIVTMAELLRDTAAGAHSPKVLRELAKMRMHRPHHAH